MSEQKLTDWFPPHVPPFRPGVYQTRCSWGAGYSKWNGVNWGSQYHWPENAERYGDEGLGDQEKEWRGLTEPADAA